MRVAKTILFIYKINFFYFLIFLIEAIGRINFNSCAFTIFATNESEINLSKKLEPPTTNKSGAKRLSK